MTRQGAARGGMGNHGSLIESYEQDSSANRVKVRQILTNGFAKAENNGGILGTIITVSPTSKVIVEIRDAGIGNFQYDKIMCDRDQRSLTETVLEHSLFREVKDGRDPVIVEIRRSKETFGVSVFGLDPSGVSSICGQVSHNFGFGLISENGHRDQVRILVPRNWRC